MVAALGLDACHFRVEEMYRDSEDFKILTRAAWTGDARQFLGQRVRPFKTTSSERRDMSQLT